MDFFTDYTLRTVALGAATLGIVSGALGTFAVLRRQSLLGDAISHAALPGIVLAFMLTGSKAPLILILGAAFAGWMATLWVMSIVRTTRIKDDSALGLVLSVFFGLGLVLLTFVQKRPDAQQAGLETYLFGQAAALLQRDVITMAILGGIAVIVLALLWKELKLVTFDREFAATLGLPTRTLDIALTTLLVIAIVIGLQTVGVVLMSAMIVAPAAAARQWTDRLGKMVILSAAMGAMAGIGGALISSSTTHLPTGPTIVLCISVIVVVSLTLSPGRGVLWKVIRQSGEARRFEQEMILCDLFELALQHEDRMHAHPLRTLEMMNRFPNKVRPGLLVLQGRGQVQAIGADEWALTERGLREAESLAIRRGISATVDAPAEPAT